MVTCPYFKVCQLRLLEEGRYKIRFANLTRICVYCVAVGAKNQSF